MFVGLAASDIDPSNFQDLNCKKNRLWARVHWDWKKWPQWLLTQMEEIDSIFVVFLFLLNYSDFSVEGKTRQFFLSFPKQAVFSKYLDIFPRNAKLVNFEKAFLIKFRESLRWKNAFFEFFSLHFLVFVFIHVRKEWKDGNVLFLSTLSFYTFSCL